MGGLKASEMRKTNWDEAAAEKWGESRGLVVDTGENRGLRDH